MGKILSFLENKMVLFLDRINSQKDDKCPYCQESEWNVNVEKPNEMIDVTATCRNCGYVLYWCLQMSKGVQLPSKFGDT